MADFKDYFSTASDDYKRFRPLYPAALFDYLARISPSTQLAWDCGCGNGQASVELAARFNRVIASDASAAQIEQALKSCRHCVLARWRRHPHPLASLAPSRGRERV